MVIHNITNEWSRCCQTHKRWNWYIRSWKVCYGIHLYNWEISTWLLNWIIHNWSLISRYWSKGLSSYMGHDVSVNNIVIRKYLRDTKLSSYFSSPIFPMHISKLKIIMIVCIVCHWAPPKAIHGKNTRLWIIKS